MLNLTNLRHLLLQVLTPGGIHTATLLTPEGQLVSFASDPPRSKDELRVIVGLSSEIWQETREQGIGMADSEVRGICICAHNGVPIKHLCIARTPACASCRGSAEVAGRRR